MERERQTEGERVREKGAVRVHAETHQSEKQTASVVSGLALHCWFFTKW